MNPQVLTAFERQTIRAYLKANGQKDIHVRQLVYLSRKHLRRIKEDLQLLERLISTYDSHVKKV